MAALLRFALAFVAVRLMACASTPGTPVLDNGFKATGTITCKE